jgi:hypothetical protein
MISIKLKYVFNLWLNTQVQTCMSKDTTLAQVFLGFGGDVLFTLGTVFSGSAFLYGVNKITSVGIGAMQTLPKWFGLDTSEKEKNEPLITKGQVWDCCSVLAKISSVMVVGTALRYGGNHIRHEEFIKGVSQVIYKNGVLQA